MRYRCIKEVQYFGSTYNVGDVLDTLRQDVPGAFVPVFPPAAPKPVTPDVVDTEPVDATPVDIEDRASTVVTPDILDVRMG